MAQYKVIAGNLAGREPGDVISDDDLATANVGALIEGGHIEMMSASAKPKTDKKDEN